MKLHSLSLSLALIVACFLDIVFFTKYASCLMLFLHLMIFRLHQSPSIFLVIVLGLLGDVYGNHLFGITSFYLIFGVMVLQHTRAWIQKLDNFWFIWLSYGTFAYLYMVLDGAIFFLRADITPVNEKDIVLVFMFVALYPLLFKSLKPLARHV